MITLYQNPLSIYARRVEMVLKEKGVEYKSVFVDMAKREHKSESYLALNPYGRVPVITDEDGLVLYESTAIVEYLDEIYPTPSLMPGDAAGRALARMHMKLADIEMGPHVVVNIFPRRFLPQERWDRAAMDKATAALERHYGILERQLAGKTYLLGDQFTLADICYVSFVEFNRLMELNVPPGVEAWSARILSRPSAVETKPKV